MAGHAEDVFDARFTQEPSKQLGDGELHGPPVYARDFM
jgi:hypothetical protein